jgi:hypothetical protein
MVKAGISPNATLSGGVEAMRAPEQPAADAKGLLMPTIDETKTMARRLRVSLAARGRDIAHSEALELVAAQLGHRDWNAASAALEGDRKAIAF